MRSRAHLRLPRNSVVALVLLSIACASGGSGHLPTSVQKSLLVEDVPGILRGLPQSISETPEFGEAIANRLNALRSHGWFVEEATGHASEDMYDQRYAQREYLIPIPPQRSKKEEVGSDFLSFAAFDRWRGWSSVLGSCFSGSRDAFERIAVGRFYRAFTPAADRVYDVIIFDPSGVGTPHIAAGEAFAQGIERVWSSFHPPEGRGFSMGIFGLARFVEPGAQERFKWGAYTVLQAYEKRFFAAFNFLHAEFGKTRTRDAYVLLALSEAEFVVVQTVLYDDTTREALVSDLGLILGAAKDEHPPHRKE